MAWNASVATVYSALTSWSGAGCVLASYFIDGVRRERVCSVLSLVCAINTGGSARCRAFQSGCMVAFFVGWRYRVFTFDILRLIIIDVKCVQCWSRPRTGIEIPIKTLIHLLLQFEFLI